MAGRAEGAPLLPPPMAAWIGGWLLRVVWAVGGVGVVAAAVALEGPGAPGAALAAGGAPAHTVLADPVAALPTPAPSPRSSLPPPRAHGPSPPPVTAASVSDRPGSVPVRTTVRRAPQPPRPVPSGSAGTRPASPPPATEPPPAGTYAYTITQDGQTAAAQLTVVDEADRAATTTQEQTWTTPDGTQRSRVGWSAGAERLAWTASDDPAGCSYQPAVVWLELPLAAGARWAGQSSCSYDGGGTPVRVVQSTAARVVTAASTSFDGRRVFCWVVERDVVTTATTDGSSATSETRTTDLFAPSWGLVVYETGKSAAPRADGTVDTGTWTVRLDE